MHSLKQTFLVFTYKIIKFSTNLLNIYYSFCLHYYFLNLFLKLVSSLNNDKNNNLFYIQ